MFAEPVSITINAVAQSLNRTGMGPNNGAFMTNDGLHRLTISHGVIAGANQRVIRLDRKQTVSNPLSTGEYFDTTDQVWLVSRTPLAGALTVTQQKQLIDGYLSYLTASSGAAITKLLGGES